MFINILMIVMKMKIYIPLVMLLIICYIKAQDERLLNVTHIDQPYPGYMFSASPFPGNFYLVDNAGEPIYNKPILSNFTILNPNLQCDSIISLFWDTKFYTFDNNFEIIDSFSCVGDYSVDFHDFEILSNGNALLMGVEERIVDLSKTVPGGFDSAFVLGNIIQELDRNRNVVFQWSSFDHFLITDVTPDIDLKQQNIVSCHMNSVIKDKDGNYIFSSRVLDEITKIDGKTGNVIWRLGGKECKNNQFRYLNDTIDGFYGFSHQHSITLLPNGNLLLFDNGNLKPNPYTRAVEYKLDETNKTVEKVWEYTPFPEIFTPAMGNAQRLPNGNTMIGWSGNSGQLFATEVKPDGTKALEITGYPTYAVYKYIYKSDVVFHFINNSGIYNFSNEKYNTDVSIEVNSYGNEGNISVEKHYYEPANLEFNYQVPLEIYHKRWTVYSDSIKDLDAIIKFNIGNDTLIDPAGARIYYRANEGKGSFYMLETIYDESEECLNAMIKGFGEFVLCSNPEIYPPIAVYPQDSSINIDISPIISWQTNPLASSYRFQLSDKSDLSNLLIDTTGFFEPWIQTELEFNTLYYWRVKAFYGNDKSHWSKVYMFITEDELSVEIQNQQDSNISVKTIGDRLLFKVNVSESDSYLFNLYDLVGNTIVESNGNYCEGQNITIDIKKPFLNSGIYFYRILIGSRTQTGKIIIQNI
jgi:hypothetical protein